MTTPVQISQAIVPHPSKLDWENPNAKTIKEWEESTRRTLDVKYLTTISQGIRVYSLAHPGRKAAQIVFVQED